jgi:hypothetical protein
MTLLTLGFRLGFMVFNATFNNISVISWRSVLLVVETVGPGENHRPLKEKSSSVIYFCNYLIKGKVACYFWLL